MMKEFIFPGCLAVLMLGLFPSLASAESAFGEAAATELSLLIPQATIIGVSIIVVVGIIVLVSVVIGMMKHL